MPSNSLRERILAGVATNLAAVVAGAVYHNTFTNVVRNMILPPNADSVPCLFVSAPEEVPYEDVARGGRRAGGGPAAGVSDRAMTVSVGCWLERDAAAESYGSSVAQDIERAVLADRTQGGKAINSWWLRTNLITQSIGEPFVWLEVQFRVQFRTVFGQPETQI